MKYFIPLLILGFIIVLVFAFTVKVEAQTLRLPNTIEINYCGEKQVWDYVFFRFFIIDMVSDGKIDPCMIKGYIKMLNTEHNFKRLSITINPWKNPRGFFQDLNNQIKLRHSL